MRKNPKPVVIEAMEKRLFLDASALTETIVSSTLPSSDSDQTVLKGTLAMTISNNSGAAEKDPGTIVSFVIASTPLDPPSFNFYILKEVKTTISLADGASKEFKLQVNVPKKNLVDGSFTVYALVVDSGSDYSQSAPGAPLVIHPPNVVLSETENLVKAPDSTTAGAKFTVQDKVAITNSGTDPNTSPLKIAIFATPDGIPADGTQMTAITRNVKINPGQTVTVPMQIAAIPTLAAGTYEFITQVTQYNGTAATSDPATAPTITLNQPTTGPEFSESFITLPGTTLTTYTYEPLDGALEYLSTLQVEMGIKNIGSTSDGDDIFTLFASPNPTFDASAMQVGQVTLPGLLTPHNALRTFNVSWNLTTDLDDYSFDDVNDYIFVQVKDATGNITMARYPTTILVGGNATDIPG